jgi:hypothetical protein
MQTCNQERHLLGDARLEFVECKDGFNWWKCLDCGETITAFHDLGCGA